MKAHIINAACSGPNLACRRAFKRGRPVHIIPGGTGALALVMPTYHYATEQEGIAAINTAIETAPTVATDEDLYRFRKEGTPHFLPAGWVDPSRR